MGVLSLFSSKKTKNKSAITDSKLLFDQYLDKGFYSGIVDNSKTMMLYFFQGKGWIGANKTFFDKMKYKDIDEFISQNDSVRDLFLSEKEEIFTESDKSWLDYIKKYESSGYRVTIAQDRGAVAIIDAKCHTSIENKKFYILELEDVTKLYNAELKTKEVEKLKTRFLANIGHEFRTPMNGVLGFIELFRQTSLDEDQSEYINMISKSSTSLMNNIETLLELSQLQGGRLEIDSYEFNILPEMEKLAYSYYKMGMEKGIKVLTFIDPKLPQELQTDTKKINQIMLSLIQNAVKFTPRGGKVIIEVKLLKRQKNGDCSIGFGVRDNGKGISLEQIALINEPFTTGSHADERLGVGLALSHGLVELFGSDLRIQSKEDAGTYVNFVLNFKGARGQNYKMMPKRKVKVLLLDQKKVEEANFLTIYLRSFALDVVKSNQLDENVYDGIDALYIVANQDDSSWMLELSKYSKKTPVVLLLEEEEKLQTKLTHIVSEVIRKPLLPSQVAKHLYSVSAMSMKETKTKVVEIKKEVNALVVEDNLINQRLIQILLQGYNISVITASNGVEAVQQCNKNKFDIIFMDIDMPEKNGIEATRDIKQNMNINKLTPIIALTAMAMEGDKEMLMESGLDDYMAKPLTRDKLEDMLNKYLKTRA
ncbi:BarA sensory histidine kinase (= VarS = GacS) [hydrothermal vent metagenome]|uniref:BarA sensory histidine kinase (= VarS = GacS) n=1 Tax=hydrothermal vent metagenome TaxID=652676 RepID=A0A1W1CTM9_9ZZZZ